MLDISINDEKLQFHTLVLDLNGTIALDGRIVPQISSLLQLLATEVKIYVLTADTFGTAQEQCATLPVLLHCLQSSDHTREKADFVRQLGQEHVVAIGNGNNDVEMLQAAKLSIGVLGPEGCAGSIFQVADVVVLGIQYALELLLKPKRCIATLRK